MICGQKVAVLTSSRWLSRNGFNRVVHTCLH